MSLCSRSVLNKFASFVNTRRQVTNINYQPPKHSKSSLFLEEFLDTQTATNSIIKTKGKFLNTKVPLSSQNILGTFLCTTIKNPKVESKNDNRSKQQMIKLYQQKEMNVRTLNVIDLDIANMTLLKNSAQRKKPYIIYLKNKKTNLSHIEVISTKKTPNVLNNSKKGRIFYTKVCPNVQNTNEMQTFEDHKPPETELQNAFDILRKDLPLLFVKRLNYSIYTDDIIFINNINEVTTVGKSGYHRQVSFLRIIGHFKFTFVKLNILKMTMHPEDNTIKIRWRIVGISGTSMILTLLKTGRMKEPTSNSSTWYDGFSTFYVNNEGKIFKHVVDKVMPDQDVQEKVKTPLETKLALFVGLLGSDFNFVQLHSKKCSKLFRIN